MLTENNMEELLRVLRECDKQLAAKVQEYTANLAGEKTHLPSPLHQLSLIPVTHCGHSYLSCFQEGAPLWSLSLLRDTLDMETHRWVFCGLGLLV